MWARGLGHKSLRVVGPRCNNPPMMRAILGCWLTAWAALAAAAPHGATLSRADLQRWLGELEASGATHIARPQPWEYVFSDGDGRKLEALSIVLVREGYRIAALRGAERGGRGELRVVRVELHNATSLARRNRELEALARARGVDSYDGVDLARGER
jgi:hypothetical protein